MNNPKISIVMSVYNGEKYLDESIQSILTQTFEDFEFIILNDCSTDNSLHVIEKYSDKDNRIFLINNNVNLGLTKSLNLGIKKAKGQYIARIDADDIALQERLKIQFDYLEKNKDIFLVGSGAYYVDENGKIITTKKALTETTDIEKELPTLNCLHHPTIMFRHEGFIYREKFVYTQDYDFYLRLLSSNKKISNIPQPLIKYRINPSAISWSKQSKQKYFALKAKEFYYQRLKYGEDEYNEFDPNDILLMDVENSTDKFVLKSEIEAKLRVIKLQEVRKLCLKYFKHFGFLNKMSIYYLLSFTGKNFVITIRKIIFR